MNHSLNKFGFYDIHRQTIGFIQVCFGEVTEQKATAFRPAIIYIFRKVY